MCDLINSFRLSSNKWKLKASQSDSQLDPLLQPGMCPGVQCMDCSTELHNEGGLFPLPAKGQFSVKGKDRRCQGGRGGVKPSRAEANYYLRCSWGRGAGGLSHMTRSPCGWPSTGPSPGCWPCSLLGGGSSSKPSLGQAMEHPVSSAAQASNFAHGCQGLSGITEGNGASEESCPGHR